MLCRAGLGEAGTAGYRVYSPVSEMWQLKLLDLI